MRKILAIASKELYMTYSDRNLILIMIATPLVMASIIAIALGGFLNQSNDVPIRDIPVVIVNQDEGSGDLNLGDIYISAMVPGEENQQSDEILPECPKVASDADDVRSNPNILYDLTDATVMSDPDAARAAVDAGEYVAAIIIPAGFTGRVSYTQDHPEIEPAAVEVYGNSGDTISASIIRSIAEAITTQIATGNIALASFSDTVIDQAPSNPQFAVQFAREDTREALSEALACAFNPAYNPLTIDQQTVTGEASTFNPFLYFGSSMAVFFMMFTAQSGANGILLERRQGTLQRLLVTPTPRISVLLGKLIGTFVNCMVQMILLFLAFTLVSRLMTGRFELIWGNNFLNVALVMVCAVLAASGLGALLNGAARTPEQGNLIGTTLVVLMGLFGGTFFPVSNIEAIRPFTYLTMTYWSVDAFTKLAQNSGSIALNLLVLSIQGIVMFGIGLWLFNRQQDA